MLANDTTLEGYVTDSLTGKPIYPAFVTVLRAPADDLGRLYGATYANPTDENGHYFYPMAAVFYDGLVVSADGYENYIVRPYNAPAGASTLNWTLNPLPAGSSEAKLEEGIQIHIVLP